VVFLTLDDILESHQNQIETYGGIHGNRDIGLLESAIAQPEASFGGQYLHADVMNHPCVDRIKRMGLEASLTFLEIKDVSFIENDEYALLALPPPLGSRWLRFESRRCAFPRRSHRSPDGGGATRTAVHRLAADGYDAKAAYARSPDVATGRQTVEALLALLSTAWQRMATIRQQKMRVPLT
jgi:death-on-curing protein